MTKVKTGVGWSPGSRAPRSSRSGHLVGVIMHIVGVILHLVGLILHLVGVILHLVGVIMHLVGVIMHKIGSAGASQYQLRA